jgi:hypothetical protein
MRNAIRIYPLHVLSIISSALAYWQTVTECYGAVEAPSSIESPTSLRQPADGTVSSIGGYTGLQLLPSLDGKWTPGGTFDDLKTRLGISALSLGPVVVTNAYSNRASQLGAQLRFSHELVAIRRRDSSLLVVNTLGAPIAVFEASTSQQVWPQRARTTATEANQEIVITFSDRSKLTLAKLPFTNYRSESMFLLSKGTTPAGKDVSIRFTVSPSSKTVTYSQIGGLLITGSAATGRVVFQHKDISVQKLTLEFRNGNITTARGAADEVMLRFDTNGTAVTGFTDKFGYKSTFMYQNGLLAGSCNHYGACASIKYDRASVTHSVNTHNYSMVTTYDATKGLPSTRSYQGWNTSYTYDRTATPMNWRVVRVTHSSATGASIEQRYMYDPYDRLLNYRDNQGYVTDYSYDPSSLTPYHEPTSIKTTLAGNTIEDLSLRYTSDGLPEHLSNALVRAGAPDREIIYAYNSLRQVVSVTYGDGTTTKAKYDDANFPDAATSVLTNNFGYEAKLNSFGQVTQVDSIPAASTVAYSYGAGGVLSSVSEHTPSTGSGFKWQGTYAKGRYLNGERLAWTAQGTTVAITKQYTWDDLFRGVVKTQTSSPNARTGMPNGSKIPLLSLVSKQAEQSAASETTTVSKPPGVRADASGCSPCSCPVQYDENTGATVPNGAEYDPSVSLNAVGGGKRER